MSSTLVSCPCCIAKVRWDNLNSHIRKVHDNYRPRTTESRGYSRVIRPPSRGVRSPLAWSWDKGSFVQNQNTDNTTNDDVMSSAKLQSSIPISDNGSYTNRSSVTSLSKVDTPASPDPLVESPDEESLQSNKFQTKDEPDNRWIVFSTPTFVFTQRRSDGFKCPIQTCKTVFDEVAEVVQHAYTAHHLEKCLYCKGVNFKPVGAMKEHVKQIHKIHSYTSPHNTPQKLTSPTFTIPSTSNSGSKVTSVCRVVNKNDATISNKQYSAQKVTKVKVTKNENLPSKMVQNTKVIVPLASKDVITTSQSLTFDAKKPIPAASNSDINQRNIQKTTEIKTKEAVGCHDDTAQKSVTKASNSDKVITKVTSPTIPTNSVSEPVKSKSTNYLSTSIHSSATDVYDRNVETSQKHNVCDTQLPGSFRDPELDNDSNFRFINSSNLVGYSLNIC